MISNCRGRRASNSSTGHFSRASGSSVWLVYARVRTVRSHASSQPSPARSSRMRISSATAIAGWVSLSWMATLSGERRPVVPAAEEPGDDVGQGAGDEEVFLDEPERAAPGRRVVRVEDAADRLGEDPVRHRAEEIAAAELAEIEDVRGRGLPEAEGVDRPPPVADHRPVVGHARAGARAAHGAPRSCPRATRTGSRAARRPSRSGAPPPTGPAGSASGRGVRPGSRRGSPGGRSRNRSGGRSRWPGSPSWPSTR